MRDETLTQLTLAVAALWGAASGALLPRAAYRLSVEPGDPWRTAKGWLGVRPGPRALPLAVLTAAACALLAAATGSRPELAAWLLLTPVCVLLATVDFAVHRLPDVLTYPLAALALLALGAATALPDPGGSWTGAALGALALGGGYLLLLLAYPKGMGFGDVKLALGLGAALGWYGWGVLFIGAFAGVLFNSLYALALVVTRRAGRKTEIPFGPFMILGGYAGVLLGAMAA
jgi:leader peptidase (prepilin peptidase)/N-methyltransferase